MKVLTLAFLLLILSAASAFCQSEISPEEYKAYAAVLRHLNKENFEDLGRNTFFVLVNKTMTSEEAFGEFGPADFTRSKSLAGDFASKSKSRSQLLNLFPTRLKYATDDEESIEKMVDAKSHQSAQDPGGLSGWEQFYQKYDGAVGYYTFSRVGFSKDKTRALVMVTQEDRSSGFSRLYTLRRSRGRWVIHTIGLGQWVAESR